MVDDGKRTLDDVIEGADIFLGCSGPKVLTQEMVKKMARAPMILALANPEPEILPPLAKEVRPDAIICTGRSDYPNQVNNVLCFPFIFRGALEVMNNFNLHTPTRILFGKGAIAGLREQIPHDARVLITYGGGSVKKTGVLDQVLDALKGMDVLEFGGIEPNPAYETLMNAVKLVREQKVTFLLAVGGGSVLDGTKFIAAAANYPENIDPWHILQTGGKEIKSAIRWAVC